MKKVANSVELLAGNAEDNTEQGESYVQRLYTTYLSRRYGKDKVQTTNYDFYHNANENQCGAVTDRSLVRVQQEEPIRSFVELFEKLDTSQFQDY